MNRSNHVVSRIAIFLAFALALMPGTMSCVKSVVEDTDTVGLSGRWARTDNSYMTTSYVEFRSDEMIECESAEAKIIQDGTIWNSSESDFVEKSSAKYTVSGGMLMMTNLQSEMSGLSGYWDSRMRPSAGLISRKKSHVTIIPAKFQSAIRY